uniref:Bm1322 n=1 Tax=Brugia malayi TaxID=6279 RepID=A0A1I9G294_BRUMA|nr:Bm1322 [Brugia malayi]
MENYIVGWLWKDSSKFISLNKQVMVEIKFEKSEEMESVAALPQKYPVVDIA